MAIIKIRNAAIDLDAAEIPNLPATKITSGTLGADRIPLLAASKIGSGTFADGRLSQSSVNQYASSFDDNQIVNDISTLALRQASDENKGSYNTNSTYVDVFQDSSGYTNGANTARNSSEYVSTFGTTITSVSNLSTTFTDASDDNHTITQSNSQWHTTHGGALGGGAGIYQYTGSNNGSLNITNNNSFIHDFGSSDFTIEMFGYNVQSSSHRGVMGYADGGVQKWQFATNPTLAVRWWASNDGSNWNMGSNGNISGNNVPSNQWFHMAVVRHGNNFYGLGNGNRQDAWTGSGALIDENSDFRVGSTGNVPNVHHGYIDQIRISNIARYTNTSYTVPSGSNGYVNDANTKLIIGSKFTQNIINATGNFTCPNVTASSSTNKMGAIITYENTHGN